MRYDKGCARQSHATTAIIGMLYVVDVSLRHKESGENIKHKLLIVGCEAADIERKLAWVFDPSIYNITLKGTEKVREKVHFLTTAIQQQTSRSGPCIARNERSQDVLQQPLISEPYDPKLFAVGVTTTMFAKDRDHALRKVGTALISQATEGASHSGASLSGDSTVVVEEIPKPKRYATSRDVSSEINRAHMVRG